MLHSVSAVLRVFPHRLTPEPDFGKHAKALWTAMSNPTLPMSRDFVTKLLNSLHAPSQPHADTNPLTDAPESVKKQLLTLQVLFPNEFLPALDLLDRRLVTRFLISDVEPGAPRTTTASAHQDVQTHHTSNTIHYVRSAQQRSSRYTTSHDSTTSYQVHLRAWNCTCPAFAFAAFPPHPEPAVEATRLTQQEEREWVFGGVSLGEGMPPVCKHLLACVLAERCCGVFGAGVEEKRVGIETAAGWAAGWGD